MKVFQNLYYIYKIPSDKINGLNKYSFKQALKDGNVVSIGDNLVLAKIREYYGDKREHQVLYNQVQNIRAEMKTIKKQQTSEENIKKLKDLQLQLDKLLFVDDIINIKVITKDQYKKLARHGFTLNGKHYVRFMVGSGQMRRNTVTFVNEKLFNFLQEHLMCGLQDKIRTINLAKLSAYFALAFSSVLWVRTPRVCVIKDYYKIIKDQKVDYIYKDENGENQIEERNLDIKLNSADGQGLISPEMAKLWAEDMHLNYVPCSFVIRTVFIKGNLVVFDFKEYARQHGITKITDRYGTEYNIEDIDVLLSESQFKMVKCYSAWEGYLSYHQDYNLKWGVTRYNKQYDDEYVLTNYQYIQILNLTKDDLEDLTFYTTNWIQNICSGDNLYALLYNVGVKNETLSLTEIINNAGSNFVKAIIKNVDMLEDGYIQRKIYNSIKESIRQAKLGRIWTKGNYQFMISDPVAQCESALGLEPLGLLKSGEIYSNFWNSRTSSKDICLMRSPLTHYSEGNICSLKNNKNLNDWYKHIYSGIVYSVYDISVVKHADGDFDGDIVFSTDNKYFLKGVYKDVLPISYEKESVPLQKITLSNQIKCDVRGLDTKVGQITNYSTSMIAMLPLFKGDKQKEQLQELHKRIKLCRELQGAEIDKIKGTTPPKFPKSWRYWKYVNKDDSDIVKSEKYKHNSMVVNKKPYFFIYLYNSLMQEYNKYQKNFDNLSMKQFGVPIKHLIKKHDKNESEMNLVRKYQKYSPVLETNCVMNLLCKTIERVDFDIQYNPNTVSILSSYASEENIDKDKIEEIYKILREYKTQRKFKGLMSIINSEGLQEEDVRDIANNILYANKVEYRNKIYNIFSSTMDIFNHLIYVCKLYNLSFDFVWDILGDDIIDVIPHKKSFIPIENSSGKEYLGCRYILKEVIE